MCVACQTVLKCLLTVVCGLMIVVVLDLTGVKADLTTSSGCVRHKHSVPFELPTLRRRYGHFGGNCRTVIKTMGHSYHLVA